MLIRSKVMLLVVVILACSVHSQSQTTPSSPTSHPQASPSQVSPKQIEELKNQLTMLQDRVKASESVASDLQTRVFTLEIAQNNHESVLLDLTSRKYQRLDTDTGTFLVSVEDASPYLDGYRVTLNIGNTSSATYKGFDLHAKWNAAYDWSKYDKASHDRWQKAIRSKDDSFTDSLDPGKWNKVDLLIPSTTGEQLGYFVLSMETSTVSLITVK